MHESLRQFPCGAMMTWVDSADHPKMLGTWPAEPPTVSRKVMLHGWQLCAFAANSTHVANLRGAVRGPACR